MNVAAIMSILTCSFTFSDNPSVSCEDERNDPGSRTFAVIYLHAGGHRETRGSSGASSILMDHIS